MKTPMQEMYDQLKASRKDEYGLAFAIDMLLENEQAMLEKEKEMLAGVWLDAQVAYQGDEYIKPSDPTFDEYYEETFNTQPKIDELAQLRKLAGLLQSVWHNGNWKAETYNEREMEKIMTEQGYWPALPNPKQIGKDELLTYNSKEK